MKNRILLTLIAGIFLFAIMNIVSAEVWISTNTIFPNESIVRYHVYYQIEDTSSDLITASKPVPIELVSNVFDLPYNITAQLPQYPNAYVDWCNYTITWQKNIYDLTNGIFTTYKIVNTTLETTNIFYQNTPATFNVSQYYLRARDGLIADMDCHYTNPDTLFIQNVYVGFITAYFPSYQCNGCGDHSFEELTNLNKQIEANGFQEVGISDKIQNIVDKNYQLWLIFFWMIKIALIFLAITLIFIAMYYLYLFFKSIAENIR